ncbi:hypothetical protein RhiirC2_721339, partial [Rhizophagus irregularis]
EENHIQKLALKILAITPHNAGCERVFSVLGWFANQRRTKLKVEKLEAMAKLHMHYIINAQKELKYTYAVIYLFQTIIEQHTGDIEEIDISPQEIIDLIIVDEVEVGYISTKIACQN